jgi:hypothetical protein
MSCGSVTQHLRTLGPRKLPNRDKALPDDYRARLHAARTLSTLCNVDTERMFSTILLVRPSASKCS